MARKNPASSARTKQDASPPPPGTPTPRQVQAKLRETRDRLSLLQQTQQLRVLEHQEKRARLMESWPFDWVSPYLELMTRYGSEWTPVGVPGSKARRYGRNFPLYQTEEELRLLREPARVLTATVPYAIGLLDGLCGYVIGTGYTYTATVADDGAYPGLADAVQEVIDEFLLRNQWGGNDAGEVRLYHAGMGLCEQPSLEEEAFKRLSVDGEFLACSTWNDDGTTDVRVIEPDQLTQPPPGVEFEYCGGVRHTSGLFSEWGFGVYTEEDDAQNPLAYYVQWGDNKDDGDVLGTDRVTHVRVNSWRTCKRGLTDWSFDTLDTFQLANLLRGNLGEGAAQQAAIVGVRQHQQGTQDEISSFNDGLADDERHDPISDRDERVSRVKRGAWEDIGAGLQYVNGPGANNASAHVLVLQGLLRAGSVRWCGTEWLASGDSSNNNFASALVANSQFVISIRRRQKLLRGAFGSIIARAVLHYARKRGIVAKFMKDGVPQTRAYAAEAVSRLVSVAVTVPSPETADPVQQAQKFAIECDHGVLSRQTWQGKVGLDPDVEQANVEEWRELNPDMGGVPLSVPGNLGGGNVSS